MSLLAGALQRHVGIANPAPGTDIETLRLAHPGLPKLVRTDYDGPSLKGKERIILLTRDPRDIGVGRFQNHPSAFTSLDGFIRDEVSGLDPIISAMNARVAQGESAERLLLVRCEDLLAETPRILKEILEFCGIHPAMRSWEETSQPCQAEAESCKPQVGIWQKELSAVSQEYCRQRMRSTLDPFYRYLPEADIETHYLDRMSALEQRAAALERDLLETRETLAGHMAAAAETATLVRSVIHHSGRTLLDCATRIGNLASSWMFFPVRNRLNKLALSLKNHGQELAAPPQSAKTPAASAEGQAASVPRSSNPNLDKLSTAHLNLRALWKKGKVPAADQASQFLDFRRQYFADSGELDQIQSLAGRHAGKRCFIIGNGPSLNEQDLSFLRDEVTLVSNWFVNAGQYAQIDPKYYCVSSHEMFGGWNKPDPFLNQDFYLAMQKKARGAHKFFSFAFKDYIREAGLFLDEKVNYLLFERPKRLVDEVGEINLDLTRQLDDGYTVIQTMCVPLAVHLGCTEIYLIGCDCNYGIQKADDPKQYCYDSKLHTTATTKFVSLERIWAENGPVFQSYSILGETLRSRGIKLFNATHGGRLEVLPRADYRSLFP